MHKILIIIAHPDIENSIINQTWIKALQHYPEQFTLHHLDKTYPDGKIDIVAEQRLIEEHHSIVLQFPIYWFNCPPLLKSWLDQVLSHGWAYGSQGKKLFNKKVGLAVSTGIREEDYSKAGRYHYSLAEILRPFEVTFGYINADYQSFFAFYGTEISPDIAQQKLNTIKLEQGFQDYLVYLQKFLPAETHLSVDEYIKSI
ncbi:MAG: NAD(P)H-dependent oxidoreductase [Acinetobacter populi]|jgi:putative NADPH-quinone reductase|uniref:NAD(P)H-dependent oxidoreductase n=1 Tax=Acinetobacter populi TaxID=1582270 RepID=UPI0023549B75|nr:NAD(P)H-dependent oxidoreductase [Acinetobacter populi]MCH4247957.1 NAD(P)H-dependent oxidoreductase [Acinetobacter populi]